MVQGRLNDAAEAMEGEVIAGDPAAGWRGAALDSRRVEGGELFFALRGERRDGHDFAGDALRRGAAAAVVRRPVEAPEGAARIRVDDPYAALHRLTRHVRRRVPRRLAAVTGSTGKTTTKELLGAMLARRFKVACSPGNLNNLYGFPLALLGIPDDCDWMVAEMGMSTPGELREISRLGRPDVGVYTNVRPVHLEFFASVEEIAEAKAELLDGLAPGATVVANRDDERVAGIAGRHAGHVVWYSTREEADCVAREIRPDPAGGTRFLLRAGGDEVEVRLPMHGLYNVENCLAAAACAHSEGVPLADVAAAAAAAGTLPGRGELHRPGGDRWLIDDSYNSNPSALALALASARELPAERRWAVLGDMLELGPEAPAFHRAAGEEAARLGFSPVVAVGELARGIADGAAAAGAETEWYADAAAAAEALANRLLPGDLVLVKGSRGIGLERVVRRLLAEGEA